MNRKKTFDNELKLITVDSSEQDKLGIPIKKEIIEKLVFCKVLDIGQKATLEARQLGVRWDKKFAINSIEYEGEEIVEFEGKRYSVDFVYGENSNEVELTCKELRQ